MKISQIASVLALAGLIVFLMSLRGCGADVKPGLEHDPAVIAFSQSVQFDFRAGLALIAAAVVLWLVAVLRALIRSRNSN